MTEACVQSRQCYCQPGQSHCGKCHVCGKPGHSCHFPGHLPYTGAWCDQHYVILCKRMDSAIELTQPFGLRDADRSYFRLPGRRRWLFWQSDTYLMEFRSQWLARYVSINANGRMRQVVRGQHPFSFWTAPLELMKAADWEEATLQEFESAWSAAD